MKKLVLLVLGFTLLLGCGTLSVMVKSIGKRIKRKSGNVSRNGIGKTKKRKGKVMSVYRKKIKVTKEDGTVEYVKSEKYWIDYYVNGKRKREPASVNYKQSLALLRKRQTEIVEGKYFDIKKEQHRVILSEVADRYLEWSKNNKRSFKSDMGFAKRLKDRFGKKYIDEISVGMVEDFKIELSKSKEKSTVNRHLSCMRGMLNMVITKRLYDVDVKLEFNPVSRVKFFNESEPRNRILSKEEVSSLMKVLDYPKYERFKPIILTAYYTGMRKGEILNLKWEDVNLQGAGYINVTKTKTNKNRRIHMHSELKNILTGVYINSKMGSLNEYVFPNEQGKPYQDIRVTFYRILKEAKIKGFVFHSFRHNFGSQLALNGFDIMTIKELLGHSKITTTQRYVHSNEGVKREAVESLPVVTNTVTKRDSVKEDKEDIVAMRM